MPVFLFPGQGSQKEGTARLFLEASDAARAVFDRAISLLPESVTAVLFDGAQEELNDTRNAQPALLCTEIAIAAHLQALDIRPDLCAGHSLGEITALVVAGALQFDEAIPFVLERARLMSEDVPEGGMAAVIGMASENVAPLLCDGAQIANYNGPGQIIISGSKAALDASITALKNNGARRILPLRVSGPFHSRFMGPAADKLAKLLNDMTVAPPAIPFLSSVSGGKESDAERIRMLLKEQLYTPVHWTTVMEQLDGLEAVEVGPGNALAGMAKRAVRAPKVFPADTPAACQRLHH
ncbi:MAG TPA: ACP S-malonyltransferase [Candidatus Hydrogenedentes bacterium]|nr:ACP S-malonyltransferase [Candidatus Hydrogenedentota bacterium]